MKNREIGWKVIVIIICAIIINQIILLNIVSIAYPHTINSTPRFLVSFYKSLIINILIYIIIIILLILDILKRKKAEKLLQESEEKYRLLVELLPVGVFVHDMEKLHFVNQTGLDLLKAEKIEDLCGKTLEDIIHPEYCEAVKERVGNVLENEKYAPLFEHKWIRLDNTVIDAEGIKRQIHYNGEKRVLSVVRDISKRKQDEEKIKMLNETLKYDKLRTEFFANMSHEFKTPLNLILGTVQLMENKINNNINIEIEDRKKYLRVLKKNSYRLLRLTNNILDITKNDSGNLELNMKNVNIVSVIEDIVLSTSEYIQNKNLELIFDTEIEEKITACDLDMIERIILNLISNAIKFTKEGDRISVTIKDKGNTIEISVKDTGIGIPEDEIGQIFEPFKQVDKSLQRNNEGSGIGLAIVKSLIDSHDGKISVQSELGKGSEFIIELPVNIISNDESERIGQDTINKDIENINIEFSDIY